MIKKIAIGLLIVVIIIFSFSTYLYLTKESNKKETYDIYNYIDEKDTIVITLEESVLFGLIQANFNDKLDKIKYYTNEADISKMYKITKTYIEKGNKEEVSKSIITKEAIYLILYGYYSDSAVINYNKIFKFTIKDNEFKFEKSYINKLN